MPRVGIVGLGSIGRRHLANLLDLGCVVVGMDVSPEAQEKASADFPSAYIVDAIPFHGLDALVIATPAAAHLQWVEEAMARKLPFFVEKPLGTLDQLPRWREIAAMDLPVNQVGYMLRFHPAVALLLGLIQAPTSGSCICDCDMSLWPGSGYTDPLLECSHELDLALRLGATAGVTEAVIQPDGSGDVQLGDRWSFSYDTRAADYSRQWTISSARGMAALLFRSPEELGVQMYRDEMAHFLECVREQKPTICPLSDGLKVLDICQQIEAMSA